MKNPSFLFRINVDETVVGHVTPHTIGGELWISEKLGFEIFFKSFIEFKNILIIIIKQRKVNMHKIKS